MPEVMNVEYPDYASDPASKEALISALVASGVSVAGGIDGVEWLAQEFMDEGSSDDDDMRRRLDTYASLPARVRIKVPMNTLSTNEQSDVSRTIARRLKAAVNGDGVPPLKDSLAEASAPLAAALDVGGTDLGADGDTLVVGAETRRPTREPTRMPISPPTQPVHNTPTRLPTRPVARPTQQPTDGPGGGSKKSKKSGSEIIGGMDDAGAIVLILFLVLLGLGMCAALAYFFVNRDDEREAHKRALYADEDPFRADDERDVTPQRSGYEEESRHGTDQDGQWPVEQGQNVQQQDASPLFSPGQEEHYDDDNMSFATGAVGGGAAAAAYGDDMTMASGVTYGDDMTMASAAPPAYGGDDAMTMATQDTHFDQMVEDEISKRNGAGFA